MEPIELTMRCHAFSNEITAKHRIRVDVDTLPSGRLMLGTVRVWDDVAGHYTACHDLSNAVKQRIHKAAAEELHAIACAVREVKAH